MGVGAVPGRPARWGGVSAPGGDGAHLGWFCWGLAHFAAVVSSWIHVARRQGRRVVVVGPAVYADRLGATGKLPPAGAGDWQWLAPAESPGGVQLPAPGSGPALLVMVATGFLGSQAAGSDTCGPAVPAVEGVERLEMEAARWVAGGHGPAICVYDLERLQDLCPTALAGVTRWALLHPGVTTAAGRVVPTERLLAGGLREVRARRISGA